jgi:hypothetical protein
MEMTLLIALYVKVLILENYFRLFLNMEEINHQADQIHAAHVRTQGINVQHATKQIL